MRTSFGAEVGRLSCFRSQKRTARSLTSSAAARSFCVMPASVRAARLQQGDKLAKKTDGSAVGYGTAAPKGPFGGFNTDYRVTTTNFRAGRVVVPGFFGSNNFATTRVGWTVGGTFQ